MAGGGARDKTRGCAADKIDLKWGNNKNGNNKRRLECDMRRATRRLVLKLVRFQNAVDVAAAGWDEAAAQDAAFDGGEFSGPGCQRMFARDERALAQRIGFQTAEAAYMAAQVLGCITRVPAWMHEPGAALPLPD
jgi:hypothetical protein